MALAGSLDREADARLEQEPGVEGKTKKLTRYSGDEEHDVDRKDDQDNDAKVNIMIPQQQENTEPAKVFSRR